MVAAAVCLLSAVPGCGGCFGEDPIEARKRREEEEARKKREKPKEDFELGRVLTLPRDGRATQLMFVKPGHWTSAWQPAKANNFDYQGELVSASTRGTGRPLPVPHTSFRIQAIRPAPLPKGQAKLFETLFFPPDYSVDGSSQGSAKIFLENRLRARRGGAEAKQKSEIASLMPSYQYFLVVLADNPDRYGYLPRLKSVAPPMVVDGFSLDNRVAHYRVMLPRAEGRLPLPSEPLAWTSIAYILWDGASPNRLSLDQQQALLDWLHWGGQMIVSGPNSLGMLRGSFLEPHLPAQGDEAIDLTAERIASLDDAWSLTSEKSKERKGLQAVRQRPLVGVRLVPHADARPLPDTDGLVIERRVGRGRIVVTAFSLTDRSVVNWGSYDSFFNACLLRRPPRTFVTAAESSEPQATWRDMPASSYMTDGRLVTRLRYFCRDAGFAQNRGKEWLDGAGGESVAGWNDGGASAEAARRTLREAAGISVPKAGFVFRTLAIYLIVLVPVNWIVFRILGRLEWAWLAAPLIALAGALVVVRLAQLDIGFARSRTEVGVLEIQGGYARGHLTRYTALYASLSTTYEMSFEERSALVLPFPHVVPLEAPDSYRDVVFRRGREQVLSGFLVKSSSAGYLHAEQIAPLKGVVQAQQDQSGRWTLQNGTELALRDVGILMGGDAGRTQRCWVGDLTPRTNVPLQFDAATGGERFFSQWSSSPVTYSSERMKRELFSQLDSNEDGRLQPEEWEPRDPLGSWSAIAGTAQELSKIDLHLAIDESYSGTLTLGRHLDLACDSWSLREGDMRLIGWTETPLSGVSIAPDPAQSLVRTLVVVHLRYGSLPEAEPDTNLLVDLDSYSVEDVTGPLPQP